MKKTSILILVLVSIEALAQATWKQKFNYSKDFVENIGQYNNRKINNITDFNY